MIYICIPTEDGWEREKYKELYDLQTLPNHKRT